MNKLILLAIILIGCNWAQMKIGHNGDTCSIYRNSIDSSIGINQYSKDTNIVDCKFKQNCISDIDSLDKITWQYFSENWNDTFQPFNIDVKYITNSFSNRYMINYLRKNRKFVDSLIPDPVSLKLKFNHTILEVLAVINIWSKNHLLVISTNYRERFLVMVDNNGIIIQAINIFYVRFFDGGINDFILTKFKPNGEIVVSEFGKEIVYKITENEIKKIK